MIPPRAQVLPGKQCTPRGASNGCRLQPVCYSGVTMMVTRDFPGPSSRLTSMGSGVTSSPSCGLVSDWLMVFTPRLQESRCRCWLRHPLHREGCHKPSSRPRLGQVSLPLFTPPLVARFIIICHVCVRLKIFLRNSCYPKGNK